MTRRSLALALLLLLALALLAGRSGLVEKFRDRLAYADIIPQRSNEGDPSRAAMIAEYDRADPLVPAGATILLGDSIAFRAPFTGRCVANRGLGGERSDQLLANLNRWRSIDRAGAVVVAVGTNDVWQDRPQRLGANIRAIVDHIAAPVYLIGLSAQIDGIAAANAVLRRACGPGCTFVDPGADLADDAIHLSPAAYAALGRRLPLRCAGTK